MYTGKHESLDIPELSTAQACALLQDVASSIDDSNCKQITSLTGSVPLALHVVGAIVNSPDLPNLNDILEQLNTSLIETLSPEDLRSEDRVNASIYLSYQYLDSDM